MTDSNNGGSSIRSMASQAVETSSETGSSGSYTSGSAHQQLLIQAQRARRRQRAMALSDAQEEHEQQQLGYHLSVVDINASISLPEHEQSNEKGKAPDDTKPKKGEGYLPNVPRLTKIAAQKGEANIKRMTSTGHLGPYPLKENVARPAPKEEPKIHAGRMLHSVRSHGSDKLSRFTNAASEVVSSLSPKSKKSPERGHAVQISGPSNFEHIGHVGVGEGTFTASQFNAHYAAGQGSRAAALPMSMPVGESVSIPTAVPSVSAPEPAVNEAGIPQTGPRPGVIASPIPPVALSRRWNRRSGFCTLASKIGEFVMNPGFEGYFWISIVLGLLSLLSLATSLGYLFAFRKLDIRLGSSSTDDPLVIWIITSIVLFAVSLISTTAMYRLRRARSTPGHEDIQLSVILPNQGGDESLSSGLEVSELSGATDSPDLENAFTVPTIAPISQLPRDPQASHQAKRVGRVYSQDASLTSSDLEARRESDFIEQLRYVTTVDRSEDASRKAPTRLSYSVRGDIGQPNTSESGPSTSVRRNALPAGLPPRDSSGGMAQSNTLNSIYTFYVESESEFPAPQRSGEPDSFRLRGYATSGARRSTSSNALAHSDSLGRVDEALGSHPITAHSRLPRDRSHRSGLGLTDVSESGSPSLRRARHASGGRAAFVYDDSESDYEGHYGPPMSPIKEHTE